jgi:Fe2+ or Zn2+ uptake regulation protein
VDVEAIQRVLEESGLRCTPQRFAVMAFLMEQNRHPTAIEIFEAVNRMDPRSSRATTYNNLRDLVQAGLVREVAVEGRAARFDAKGLLHHHFICDTCGNVEDIDWYEVPKPDAASLGKRMVRECEVIFRGVCAKCRVDLDGGFAEKETQILRCAQDDNNEHATASVTLSVNS